MSHIEWNPIPNSLDYQTPDGQYVAIYHSTIKGLPKYLVFRADQKKKTMTTALDVGGLPKDWKFAK